MKAKTKIHLKLLSLAVCGKLIDLIDEWMSYLIQGAGNTEVKTNKNWTDEEALGFMEHVYGRETLTKTRRGKKKDPNKHQIKNKKKKRYWKKSGWDKGTVGRVKKTDLSDGKKPLIKGPSVRERQAEGGAGWKAAGRELAVTLQDYVTRDGEVEGGGADHVGFVT